MVLSINSKLSLNLGIIGAVLQYITPLTIAPAVAMIGLALFPVAGNTASSNWGIAMG